MSDALDRLVGPGIDLLERVDAALTADGLPAGHPVAGLLRELGALPTDALHAIAARRPTPLRAAADGLRRAIDGYEQQRDLLATLAGWGGVAGDRFAAHHTALAAFLAEAGEVAEPSLVGRLRATAAYLDDVAEWVRRSRLDTARALADVLGSMEAVRLHATGDAAAAATIGAWVLTAAATAYEEGQALAARWAGRLDEVVLRLPTVDGPPVAGTRLAL